MTFHYPKLTNTYVDDTIGWAIESRKQHINGTLRHQLGKVVDWCKMNKIIINADETHVIFNEHHTGDCIRLNEMTIKTAESVRYLGAELVTNDAENNSTFIVRTSGIAKSIINRCNIIKKLRKFRIPEKVFQQACHAFIGGMFNYFLPWIGGECAVKAKFDLYRLPIMNI